MSSNTNTKNNNDQYPVFEIKKWNAVALWAWGKFKIYFISNNQNHNT